MSNEEEHSPRPKLWIWILLLIAFGLLLVPILSLGIAIRKSGWKPFIHQFIPSVPLHQPEPILQKISDLSALRATIERVAATTIHLPILESRVKEVEIQAPPESMNVTTNEIHKVLIDQKHQFVEAMDKNEIRIIVILESTDWPALERGLENAAAKDGFMYRGPSETETAKQADTMVAEIDIVRKQGK